MAKPDLKSLTKKEKKDYLRQYRAKEETLSRLKRNLIILGALVIGVVLIGGGTFLFTREAVPKKEIGEAIAIQGRNHIQPGSKHDPYNSNPPTSGPHWATPAQCKIYTEEIPDEAVIHSLEHGAVWLSYKDKNNQDLVKKLTELVGKNPNKLILSPRREDESAIAVASWGRLLKLENFEENQISDFINNYKNTSPEPAGTC